MSNMKGNEHMIVREYVNICWRTRRLRQVIFAFEIFRNTGGTITCYIQFGDRTIWIRKGY